MQITLYNSLDIINNTEYNNHEITERRCSKNPMSKSVYSLVLSDDVVAAVDRAAYSLGSSRSNLINQILAEYVSFITPEKRRKDIFDALASVIGGFEPFQVQTRGSDNILNIRSPLRVKYNPTIKYTVELSRGSGSEIGQLKIMTRTQSEALIKMLDEFFCQFSQIEQRYLRRLFPELRPHYKIRQGRLVRNFSLLKDGCKNHEIGSAIAAYIQMIDRALKECIGQPPECWEERIEAVYLEYLKETPIIC